MFKRSLLCLMFSSILLFSGCLIKGRVVNESGVGVFGVTVTLNGGASMTTTTNSDGYYQFGTVSNMLSAGSYTITPSGNPTPASKNVSITTGTLEGLGDVPMSVGGVDFTTNSFNIADYFPHVFGNYWKYRNSVDSSDTYTQSVFQSLTYEGNPALRFGIDMNNHAIVHNNGNSITIYAVVEDGISLDEGYPVTIEEFTDGTFFNHGEPTNFTLLRMWDNLDPALKGIYNIDPSLKNLLFWVTYSSNYKGNSHNPIVESNLSAGVSIPDYSVTHLQWYQLGVGEIVKLDIDSSSGTLGDRYNLVDYNIVP